MRRLVEMVGLTALSCCTLTLLGCIVAVIVFDYKPHALLELLQCTQ